MNEMEAMNRATPRLRWLALSTLAVWVVVIGGTTALTTGDYHRTYPSPLWFWAVALCVSWTVGALRSMVDNLDPELEKVSLHALRFSSRQPVPLQNPEDINALESRRHQVLGEYGAFLSDIVAIATMPLLADPTCPPTDAFREALVAAEDAHSLVMRGASKMTEYAAAVRELERAWHKARSYAERKGSATLAPDEQDAVRRARNLLDVALDDKAFPAERRAAMHKAVRLLRTVVEIPEQARAAIDYRVKRLELEA